MVEVQASVDGLTKVARAAIEMLKHDPERLAKADKASMRECQRLAIEVDRLLDDAASLIRECGTALVPKLTRRRPKTDTRASQLTEHISNQCCLTSTCSRKIEIKNRPPITNMC